MELTELCKEIGLPKDAAEILSQLEKEDDCYDAMHALFRKDRESFYKKISEQEEPEELFLYYYSRFACEVYEDYRKRGIEDRIFFDTFRDISIWCEAYYRDTGKYGLGNYVKDWFWRGLEMKLLRLGRLEYEEMASEEEITGENVYIRKGEAVINIHIPAGEPLERDQCLKSIEVAYRRLGNERQYICHSWLLFSGLKEILPEKSNILRFQELFNIVKVDYREREAEWRIFGQQFFRVADYAERTSLQRQVKQYLLAGGSLGNGLGVLKRELYNNNSM